MTDNPFAANPQAPLGPAPTQAPAPTGRGPKVLIVCGVVGLVLGIVVAVLAGRAFFGVLPTGVLDAQGAPGSDVVAEVPLPGPAAVELPSRTTYVVLHRTTVGQATRVPVTVTDPNGAAVRTRGPSVSLHVGLGGADARSIAEFTTTGSGDYTIGGGHAAPADGESSLLLVETAGAGSFVGGIFATIAGVFGAIGLGALGIGLLIGGLIWRHVRRKPRSAVVRHHP